MFSQRNIQFIAFISSSVFTAINHGALYVSNVIFEICTYILPCSARLIPIMLAFNRRHNSRFKLLVVYISHQAQLSISEHSILLPQGPLYSTGYMNVPFPIMVVAIKSTAVYLSLIIITGYNC